MLSKANYTKECISKALIHLLQRYPIEQITISKLVDEAQVSRGAFYNHYSRLEDVLKETYQNAHQDAFEDKLEDIQYLLSHDYIRDMISFFNNNSELLLAVYKWDLLDFIPKEKTEKVIQHTQQFQDPVIQKHPFYFMCYSHIRYFTICIAWLLNGKKESPQELFEIILHFNHIEQNHHQS